MKNKLYALIIAVVLMSPLMCMAQSKVKQPAPEKKIHHAVEKKHVPVPDTYQQPAKRAKMYLNYAHHIHTTEKYD